MLCGDIIDGVKAQLKTGKGEDEQLIAAVKLAVMHAALAYMSICTREKITNGAALSSLKKKWVRIIGVYAGDKRIDYQIIDDKITAAEPFDSITYSYVPKITDRDSEFETLVPVEVMTLGACGEYLIASARYDEGAMYVSRFEAALAELKKRPYRLPSRRLI